MNIDPIGLVGAGATSLATALGGVLFERRRRKLKDAGAALENETAAFNLYRETLGVLYRTQEHLLGAQRELAECVHAREDAERRFAALEATNARLEQEVARIVAREVEHEAAAEETHDAL